MLSDRIGMRWLRTREVCGARGARWWVVYCSNNWRECGKRSSLADRRQANCGLTLWRRLKTMTGTETLVLGETAQVHPLTAALRNGLAHRMAHDGLATKVAAALFRGGIGRKPRDE